MTRLESLAAAIQNHEGWYFMSRSWRDNNPGNLRWSKFQAGQRGGFAYFDSFASGWLALWWDLLRKCTGHTITGLNENSTLQQLFDKWAPWADGNDPDAYARAVANYLGISTDTPLKYFTDDLN